MRRNRIVPLNAPTDEPRGYKYGGTETCDAVRRMAQQGKFPETWCAELGITVSTLYKWANDYEDFEQAVEEGWHILHAVYERMLFEAIRSELKTTPSLLKAMARRFPSTWGEQARNTLEHFKARNDPDPEETVSRLRDARDEDLHARIRELQERLDDVESGQ